MQQDHQSETANSSAISAEQVSNYLRNSPHFFEQHASLLADIYLPSPHGSGAISLAERQQLAQRDKIHALENRLVTLIGYAEENDETSKKIHDFSVNLLKSKNFDAVQAAIIKCMQEDFLVSESAIRIWANPNDDETPSDYTPENKDFIEWVNDLTRPYCGEMPDITKNLLGDQLQSFVFIPLYKNTAEKQTFGVLILGSVDAQHFKSDMGVMYLERIGDLVGAALSSHI